jgi:hypothetical protein
MGNELRIKKIITAILIITLLAIRQTLIAREALAVCPVCTVAVGAGLGLSRYLGIDDAISGIWIGGLTLSVSLWLVDWISKKKFKTIQQFNHSTISLSLIALMYILVLLPLWYSKMIGVAGNTIFGIDKLLIGIVLGSITFLSAVFADKKLREIKGKQLFNYQKVAFPVSSLAIISLILNLLIT